MRDTPSGTRSPAACLKTITAPDTTAEPTLTHPPWDPFDLAQDAKDARLREEARSEPFIIIDYRSHTDTWSAWWTDKISLLGRFDGTREEAIAWARERSDNIRICSDPHDDNSPAVELGPDDQ